MNISSLHHLKSLKPLNIRGDPWPVMANTFPAAASYVIQKTSGVLQLLKHHLICSDKYMLTSPPNFRAYCRKPVAIGAFAPIIFQGCRTSNFSPHPSPSTCKLKGGTESVMASSCVTGGRMNPFNNRRSYGYGYCSKGSYCWKVHFLGSNIFKSYCSQCFYHWLVQDLKGCAEKSEKLPKCQVHTPLLGAL